MCPLSVISSLHFFGKVQWNDKGNYTCVAHNGANGPQSLSSTASSATVNVVHAPMPLNQRYPDEALAASEAGSTVRLPLKQFFARSFVDVKDDSHLTISSFRPAFRALCQQGRNQSSSGVTMASKSAKSRIDTPSDPVGSTTAWTNTSRSWS